MLVWLTLPFYDFCGFRSVAVNSVYKLQFFTFIFYNADLIFADPPIIAFLQEESQYSTRFSKDGLTVPH